MAPSSPRPESFTASAAVAAAAAGAGVPLPPARPGQRRRPTRRTAHTVEAIVAAAVEVLDEAGVAGFSMRRVAERLGTGPASLYAHVSGREELLELVFDELIGQVPLVEPDPDRWREQLRAMLTDLRAILGSHRDAALAGLGRIPTSPQMLAGAESLVAVMRAGGLTDRAIALGLDQLVLLVSASAFEAGLYRQGMGVEELAAYFDAVHDFYAKLPAAQFPVLASIAHAMTGPDGDERFRFGLDAMIAGIEALSDRERAQCAGAPWPASGSGSGAGRSSARASRAE